MIKLILEKLIFQGHKISSFSEIELHDFFDIMIPLVILYMKVFRWRYKKIN